MYFKNKSGTRIFILFFLLLSFFTPAGAASPGANGNNTGSGSTEITEKVYTFEILQAGWHTGIVLKTRDVPVHDWPDVINYLQHKYVDIGYGDERFYQADGNPPLLAARAVLFPTRAVIHIVPFSVPPQKLYAGEIHVDTLNATPEQFAALCRNVSESFERDENGHPVKSPFSENRDNFFRAREKYHLFHTCNTWVAVCLQQSGFSIDPAGIITGRQLAAEIEKLRVK